MTSGATAPPDGTMIALLVDDLARGGAVSRTAVAYAAGNAELKIATAQGSAAPSGAFAYGLSFHNMGAAALDDVSLVLPLPAGASFVSADGGGTLGADGVVRWSLGTLAGFAGGTRNVQLTAGGFRVPDFTSNAGFGVGSFRNAAFSHVAAGASMETTINLLVTSGGAAPPTGTLINLTVADGARGTVVARTIRTN